MKNKLRTIMKSFLEAVLHLLYLLLDILTPHPHNRFSSIIIMAVYSGGGIIVLTLPVIMQFIEPINKQRFLSTLVLGIGFSIFSFYVVIKAYKRFKELNIATPQNF